MPEASLITSWLEISGYPSGELPTEECYKGKSIVNDCSATPDVVVDCAEFRCMVGGQWSCYQAP